mgnify:FL=1
MNRHGRLIQVIKLATAATTLSAILAMSWSSVAVAESPTVSVGSGPNGVAVNPSTNTIYVTNYGGNSVSVINGSTNTVTATVSVGSHPLGVAVNPSTNTIYVANYDDNTVSVMLGVVLPGAPSITSSSAGNGSVSLAWSAPSAGDGQIISYSVVVAPSSGPAITTSTPASQLSAMITGLRNGTSYSVSVTAVSSLGAGSASSSVSLTPRNVPTAPTSPKATSGKKSVTLRWSPPSSTGGSAITGYKIYMGTSPGRESATPLNDNLVSTLTYVASSLKTRKKYYFVIKAVNAAGMSTASVEVAAKAG